MTERAWLGLGANLGDAQATLSQAVDQLAHAGFGQLVAVSSLYRTPPWGVEDQADFLNAVVALETELAPSDLLSRLLHTEAQLGRVRSGKRWGPRAIDIDLLMQDHHLIDQAELCLPHPRLAKRAFVLVPWLELAPTLVVPGMGALADLLDALPAAERDGPVRIARPDDWQDSLQVTKT
ncbi:MAG: 2-amino-4-hydroxy-6-hydroxymethyldihydropteridine diphosphokinase [Wenzhouxiangella sp.]